MQQLIYNQVSRQSVRIPPVSCRMFPESPSGCSGIRRRIMKKSVTLMFVVIFVFAFYLGTVVAPNLQEVKVNIDYNMKMFLHGQPFNPVDTSTVISYRPIIYKNKIYLPAKDVCDASKLAIDYDLKGNVLNIGEFSNKLIINISICYFTIYITSPSNYITLFDTNTINI